MDRTTRIKWEQMKDGQRVVAGDLEMDEFEAQPEWRRLCSIHNPDRVSTRDGYLVWLKQD